MVVTDTLPEAVTLTGIPSECVETGSRTISCNLGTMTVNSERTVAISVLINSHNNAMGNYQLVNQAAVTSNEADPDATNSETSVEIDVVNYRVGESLVVLYGFNEGTGATVHDLSNVEPSLNLNLADPVATTWVSGGLSVSAPTSLATSAPAAKLSDAINATGELTLEAWLQPTSTKPGILGEIVSMATNVDDLNLTLQQRPTTDNFASRYYARVRTGGGSKSLSLPLKLLSEELTHVIYTRDNQNIVRFYINGTEVADRTLEGGFVDWDITLPLILANGPNGDQPWLGEYKLLAFYNRALSPGEIEQHFEDGPQLNVNIHNQ